MNTNRTVLIASFALAAGTGIGVAISALTDSGEPLVPSSSATDPRSALVDASALAPKSAGELAALGVASPPEGTPASSDEQSAVETAAVEAALPEADGTVAPRIASLTARLDAERNARRRLERELTQVKTALQTLERRFTSLAARSDGAGRNPQATAAGNGGVDAGALIAAGFSAPEADALAQRWGEQQMDLLYLRDQAIREGWLDTPRYEEAVQELRNSGPSLREELGDDGYDRFLHATGRPNRVAVTSVFESSPGQIAGLQPGDTIISYDETPIRSGADLRSATTDGAPGEPVTVRILRDGEPVDLSLLRGPIGIQMDAVSVAPD